MTLGEALTDAAAVLAAAGIEDPRREARLLLAHATGLDPASLLLRRDEPSQAAEFSQLVQRRAAHEPMALITGRQGFWSIELAVSPDTLIPRADTETLIEAALALFQDRGAVTRILDFGTGTGCLLLAALTEFPLAWGVGVELSPEAAALARRNAAGLGLAGRSSVVSGNWADALVGRFDLVLANPPYIESEAITGLMPEVSRYEPLRALDGGPDGLAAYRAIIAALPQVLAPEGIAIMELGIGQADTVAALVRSVAMHPLPPYVDLAGIPRALAVMKKPFGGPAMVV